jgi:hypothetical protein
MAASVQPLQVPAQQRLHVGVSGTAAAAQLAAQRRQDGSNSIQPKHQQPLCGAVGAAGAQVPVQQRLHVEASNAAAAAVANVCRRSFVGAAAHSHQQTALHVHELLDFTSPTLHCQQMQAAHLAVQRHQLSSASR